MEGEVTNQEKNTETKTKFKFQCALPLSLSKSDTGQGLQPLEASTLGTQAQHEPSIQAQPPVLLERTLVWKEHVQAQINGSKSFWAMLQMCMHEQAPFHHIAISEESGLLLNANET